MFSRLYKKDFRKYVDFIIFLQNGVGIGTLRFSGLPRHQRAHPSVFLDKSTAN